jgi:hypothetical protein
MSSSDRGPGGSEPLNPRLRVAPPSIEVLTHVVRTVFRELRLLGASFGEIEDCVENAIVYVDLAWPALGLYRLASLNPELFDDHIRMHCSRYWRSRLGQSLSTIQPFSNKWPGPLDVSELAGRTRLLNLSDRAHLPERCQLVLELVLVWGFSLDRAADALGISRTDALLELAEARTILRDLAAEDAASEPPPTDKRGAD